MHQIFNSKLHFAAGYFGEEEYPMRQSSANHSALRFLLQYKGAILFKRAKQIYFLIFGWKWIEIAREILAWRHCQIQPAEPKKQHEHAWR
jgi:hypothetical protein